MMRVSEVTGKLRLGDGETGSDVVSMQMHDGLLYKYEYFPVNRGMDTLRARAVHAAAYMQNIAYA